MKYEKICRVCGKSFITNNSRYAMCSKECSHNYQLEYARKHNADPQYRACANKRRRARTRSNPKIVICGICGQPVPPKYNGSDHVCYKRYHEECVLKEAYEALDENAKSYDKRIQRAHNTYGYNVNELREMKLYECTDT